MTRPNCMRCGHPVATPDDWRDIPEGGEEGLCWGTRGDPCAERLPVLKTCADCTKAHCGIAGWRCLGNAAALLQRDTTRELETVPPSWCPLRGEP